MNNIITISREFGSGGRELGERLAEALGYAYYDHAIVDALAAEQNLDSDYLEKMLDSNVLNQYQITYTRTFYSRTQSGVNPAELLGAETRIIKQMAQKSNCVIIGCGAGAILEEYDPFRIFVYANMDVKLKRCMERAPEGENLSEKEMVKKIKQIDKAREANNSLVSATAWGDIRSYDLCINTTCWEIDEIVGILTEFVRKWFQ